MTRTLRFSIFVVLLLSLAATARAESGDEPPPAEPAAPAPLESGRPWHPEPRVIVSVLSVRGPHRRADVERSARLGWGRIVGCYKKNAKRQRGKISMEWVVSGAGQVSGARTKRSTFRTKQVAGCVAHAVRGLAMPKARGGSVVRVQVELAPGDMEGGESDP